MAENNKIYITANELAEMLGEKEGFLVIAAKVPRRYFEKRWYGFSA